MIYPCCAGKTNFSHMFHFLKTLWTIWSQKFLILVLCAYLIHSLLLMSHSIISGCMASLSSMIQPELPRVNLLTKTDLVANKKDIEDFLNPETWVLSSELNQHMAAQFAKLNKALAHLVDVFSMVNFVPLDLRKESSTRYLLQKKM